MAKEKKTTYDQRVWEKANGLLAKRLQTIVTDPGALAEHLGCTVQAVNQYKLGTAFPKTENLIKIAEYYGISVDYLLGFSSIPNRDTSLQAVNEVTGLSESAIIKLSDISQSNPAFSEIISLLLEDTNCEYFLALIQGLFNERSDLIELNVQGKTMQIQDRNLLAAVLQTKLIENIANIARAFQKRR